MPLYCILLCIIIIICSWLLSVVNLNNMMNMNMSKINEVENFLKVASEHGHFKRKIQLLTTLILHTQLVHTIRGRPRHCPTGGLGSLTGELYY